jgi:hypothetical protein
MRTAGKCELRLAKKPLKKSSPRKQLMVENNPVEKNSCWKKWTAGRHQSRGTVRTSAD